MALAALVIVILDQLTKLWIASSLQVGGSISVVDGIARLRYTHNTGAAFGMLSDSTGFLSIVSLVVIIGILVAFVRFGSHTRLSVLAAGLVVGGALGNLVDRIRLGYVVDFFEVYNPNLKINNTVYTFPVFNVADSAITVGVIIILITLIFMNPIDQPKPAANPPTESEASDPQAPTDSHSITRNS